MGRSTWLAVVASALLGCVKPPTLGDLPAGTEGTQGSDSGNGGDDDGPEAGDDDGATGSDDADDVGDETVTSAGPGDGGTTTSGGDDDTTTGGVVGDCDPYAQDCPVGEKCVPVQPAASSMWSGYVCASIEGAGSAGRGCTLADPEAGLDDCGAGLYCFADRCTPLCGGTPATPTCDDPNDACAFDLCLTVCDPLLQDCAANLACYSTLGDAFVCMPEGATGPGLDCAWFDECIAGYACADVATQPDCTGGLGCCAPFCDLGEGDPNPTCTHPRTVCAPWFPEGQAPPGYENIGVCRLPL